MRNSISIENDVYVFICANFRNKIRACGNDKDMTDQIYSYFQKAVNRNRDRFRSNRLIKINKTGCLGRCGYGPNIVIFPDNIWYQYQSLQDIDKIIYDHLIQGKIVEELRVFLN
jgi:(2Fe-2S) ferredoxin